MAFDNDRLNDIYDRTDGFCHICGKKVAWSNYGVFGARGAWEVEHSVPRARGGTDRLNNLYAACIPCNRSKRDGSTRTARGRHGRLSAPLSASRKRAERRKSAICGAIIGGVGARLFGATPEQALAVAAASAYVGHKREPDRQRR
ncbi:MAG TPA: HNH endonuclease [Kofleriaceae bacterium]|nr:HNH endonuclease [Kofleriaceae bacterium]